MAVLYREETNNERDMYLVLWDQDRGQMTRTRVSRTLWKIDACPMSYYTITRDRGGFVAVWPTRGEIYFARLDGKGDPSPPAEIKTPGRSGMRTGMLALSAPDGSTLVAWKKDGQIGWQLYDAEGQPLGAARFREEFGQRRRRCGGQGRPLHPLPLAGRGLNPERSAAAGRRRFAVHDLRGWCRIGPIRGRRDDTGRTCKAAGGTGTGTQETGPMATTRRSATKRPVEYPTSDGKPMAETDVHRKDMVDLIATLEDYFAADPRVYVSGNLMFFYEEGNRRKHIAPDVLVVRGVPKLPLRKYYLLWEEGRGPDLVIELTSKTTRREDRDKKWVLYRDRLRVPEYFLFDPFEEYLKPSLQGYRLVEGQYVAIGSEAGRLPSGVLGLHLERLGARAGPRASA